MSLRETRRKIARKISHSNLPGSGIASILVRDPKDNKDLDESLKIVVDGFERRRQVARPLIETYPAIGKWATDKELGKVEINGHPCNPLIIEQVLSQMTDFGTPDQINAYFVKYVKDTYTLRATIVSIMSLLRKYIDWGYVIEHADGPPTNNIEEADTPILFNRVMNYMAESLARADSSLEEDLVAVDLKQIFA